MQICQEKDVLCGRIRHKVMSPRANIVKKRMSQYAKLSRKKTSCDVEFVKLDVKCRVVVQDCQQEDDSLRKFVKKKDVLRH